MRLRRLINGLKAPLIDSIKPATDLYMAVYVSLLAFHFLFESLSLYTGMKICVNFLMHICTIIHILPQRFFTNVTCILTRASFLDLIIHDIVMFFVGC